MQPAASMLEIYSLFVYVAVLFQIGHTQEYCEYGSYISPRSGFQNCCIKCKTVNLREKFREPQCRIEYNDCASDSGIYTQYNVPDELTGSADPAVIHCPSDFVVNCDERKNFTISKDYKLNVTKEGNIKDLQCTPPLGTVLELGSHLVVCTATDLIKENEISCNFSVTVNDNQIPTIECLSITFDTIPGKSYANVTYYPKVWDNSGDVNLEVNCSLSQHGNKYRTLSPHLERLHIGEYNITCDVFDTSSNMNTCSGMFFVRDNEIPYIECGDKNYTVDPGKIVSNFTYLPKVWDNSGEELEPNCSIPNGSSLPAGNYSLRCIVNDESMNTNSCSANIYVIENKSDDVIRKNSKNRHLIWYFVLPIPAVVLIIVCAVYAKWKNRTKYHSSEYEFREVISGDPLVVKNCGSKFVEVQLSTQLQQRCTKVTIEVKKANNSSQMEIKTDELSTIMAFTDLSEEENQTFMVTGFSENECIYRRTQIITKHKNMSAMFAGCKLEDVTYDSITVKYMTSGANLASIVWLVVRHSDKCCRQSDQTVNSYKEKKIDRSSLQHTFEGLKPGHSYDVTVELRTIMKVTIKDTYNIGHKKTKSVEKISEEVNPCNVVLQFRIMDGDSKPFASTTCSCGIPATPDDNRVTVNNLQPDSSYSISYGVTYNGKNIQQDKTTIRTKPAVPDAILFETVCSCNIIGLLLTEENQRRFDDLINSIDKPDLFLKRFATALKMDTPFIKFKSEASKGETQWSGTLFVNILLNRSAMLEDMKVNEFLKLFNDSFEGSEFVVADEREPLLGGNEDKFFQFCQLLEKIHIDCTACQPLFHQYVHSSSFYM